MKVATAVESFAIVHDVGLLVDDADGTYACMHVLPYFDACLFDMPVSNALHKPLLGVESDDPITTIVMILVQVLLNFNLSKLRPST